jgi:hypothetical protein
LIMSTFSMRSFRFEAFYSNGRIVGMSHK